MNTPFESRLISTIKAILLSIAMTIALWTQTSPTAQIAAVALTLCGAILGRVLAAKELKLSIAIGVIWLGFLMAFIGPEWVRNTSALPFLDARNTLIFSDCVGFGLLGLTMAFGLRYLSCRWRAWSVFEAAVVVGSVIWLFRQHQNERIDRPRFLADWALMQGYDPTSIIMIIGAVVGGVAMGMVLYQQSVRKLALSVILLGALGYWYSWDQQDTPDFCEESCLDQTRLFKADCLASGEDESTCERQAEEKEDACIQKCEDQGGQGEDSQGQGKEPGEPGTPGAPGSGGGVTDQMMRNESNSSTNDPVAVAIFHQDYEPPNDILYFRQQVLSLYDGKRLSIDTVNEFDEDVIREFPYRSSIQAGENLSEDFHLPIHTSMYLMADHPQPVALTSSVEITPTKNPAPHKFLTAYDVVSWVSATPIHDMRLLGRASIPSDWTKEKADHYLAYADDPRYESLSNELVRDIDPRYADDTLVKALKIKTYLEKEGFYTRKERHAGVDDSTASFLFGNLKGYCVHFANAAAHLFRSQGIASRVAVGYAVQGRLRGNGSAVLIMADRAHAWPEIHIEGVGWVPFDIYPERSDEPPGDIVPQDLESLLGEIARGDLSGGRADEAIETPFEMPWTRIQTFLIVLCILLLGMAYFVKGWRKVRGLFGSHRTVLTYVALQDSLNGRGLGRWYGETRDQHALRIRDIVPSLTPLTEAHLRRQIGGRMEHDDDFFALCTDVRRELRTNLPLWKTILGMINPIGWWYTK